MAKKNAKPESKQKHNKVKKSSLYIIEGDSVKRKNENCPKCGPGVFLGKRPAGEGKIRHYCGKCFLTIEKKE
jgi:ribosomal protein S27AE